MISRGESVLENGLPLVELGIEGTRAVTLLVAFDAGARTERPEENGIAHFLEHLVFKGSERFPTTRDITRRSEGLGARLNAYTSHDLVAFHITCRAEVAIEAADLLTDFVAGPHLDPEALERERGVVIQEIAQSDDQPPRLAGKLLDSAAWGEHPLGRSVLGPAEHLRSFSREQILSFRDRRWVPSRGAAFVAGNLSGLDTAGLRELLARFPSRPEPEPVEAAPSFERRVLIERRDTHQSHLRLHWPAPVDPRDGAQRAAFAIYSTILGGSMGSRLFEELREQRGLCYSVWASGASHADASGLSVGAGLESSKCVEAYERIVEMVAELAAGGPSTDELERVRPYAAGSLVLALERSQAVAARAADRRLVLDERDAPDKAIAALEAVTGADVREIAGYIAGAPAVACVGPHDEADFG